MSILNTQLLTSTVLTAGAVIPVGSVIHKSCRNINATANSIRISGAGYYKITANVTVAPTAVANMTVSVNDNGSVIASASSTPAVAGDPVNLTLIALIYNRCGCNEDVITFDVNTAGTVTEMDVIVEAI